MSSLRVLLIFLCIRLNVIQLNGLSNYICGDGICSTPEEGVCPLDCPGNIADLGVSLDDLFLNEKKTIDSITYSGLDAIKRYTLSDMNNVEISRKIHSNGVLEVEGYFTVGTITLVNKNEIPNGDLTAQYQETVIFDYWLLLPPGSAPIKFAHITGLYDDESFRENELSPLINGADDGWISLAARDFWSDYGYSGISDFAKKSRYYTLLYGTKENNDVFDIDIMRYDLIYILTLSKMRAVTLFKLICDIEKSTTNCLEDGVSVQGKSKGGWSTWTHSRSDDRVKVFHAARFQVESSYDVSIDYTYHDIGCNADLFGLAFRNDVELLNENYLEFGRFLEYTQTGKGWTEIYSPFEFYKDIPSAITWSIGSGDTNQISSTQTTHDNQFNLGHESKFYYNELEPYITTNNIIFRHQRESALDVNELSNKDRAIHLIALSKQHRVPMDNNYLFPKIEYVTYNRSPHPTLVNKDIITVTSNIINGDNNNNNDVKLYLGINPNDINGPASRLWNYKVYPSDWKSYDMIYNSQTKLWSISITFPSSFNKYTTYYVRITHTIQPYGFTVSDSSLPKFNNQPPPKQCIFLL